MTCKTWCLEPQSSKKLIWKVVIIKFGFVQVMSERSLSRPKMVYMSGWSCLLAWQMLPALSCEWWPRYCDLLWVNSWSSTLMIFWFTVRHWSTMWVILNKFFMCCGKNNCTEILRSACLWLIESYSWSLLSQLKGFQLILRKSRRL